MISPEPRSTTEIRDYLIGELNSALRRRRRFGPIVAPSLIDAVACS